MPTRWAQGTRTSHDPSPLHQGAWEAAWSGHLLQAEPTCVPASGPSRAVQSLALPSWRPFQPRVAFSLFYSTFPLLNLVSRIRPHTRALVTLKPAPLPVGGTGRDRAGWGCGKFVRLSVVLFPQSHQLLISCHLPSTVQRHNLIDLCFSLLVPFLFFKSNIVCINKMPKEMKVTWQEGVFFNCLGCVCVCVCVCVF